jgi:hypothetical protein
MSACGAEMIKRPGRRFPFEVVRGSGTRRRMALRLSALHGLPNAIALSREGTGMDYPPPDAARIISMMPEKSFPAFPSRENRA